MPKNVLKTPLRLFALMAAIFVFATPVSALESETVIGKIVKKDPGLGYFYIDVGCDKCIGRSAAHVKDSAGKVQRIKLMGYSFSKPNIYAAEPREQKMKDLSIGQKVFQMR